MTECLSFLCYRRVDGTPVADWLYGKLHGQPIRLANDEDATLSVYYDQATPAVGDWCALHQRALEQSFAFILVCTPGVGIRAENSADSVHREVAWWIKHRSGIPPIVIDTTGEGDRWIPQLVTKRWPMIQRVDVHTDGLGRLDEEIGRFQSERLIARIREGIRLSHTKAVEAELDRTKSQARKLLFASIAATVLFLTTSLFAILASSSKHKAERVAEEATCQAHLARAAEIKANSATSQAQRELYCSQVFTAGKTIQDSDYPTARKTLWACSEAMRNWEWGYLLRLCMLDLATLVGHTDAVTAAKFSPDGSRVLTRAEDKTVRVWDAKTGRQLASFTPSHGRVIDAAFEADGASVRALCAGDRPGLWDVGTGRELFALEPSLPGGVACDADCASVCAVLQNGTIGVWQVDTGHRVASLAKRVASVRCICCNSRATKVAIVCSDDSVTIWNTETGSETHVSLEQYRPTLVEQAVFSSQGGLLAIVLLCRAENHAQSNVLLLNATTGELVASLPGEAHVRKVAFNTGDTMIAIADASPQVYLWRYDAIEAAASHRLGRPLKVGSRHGGVMDIAFSHDSMYIVTASSDRNATISTCSEWKVDSHSISQRGIWWENVQEVDRLCGHDDGLLCASYSPDATRIVTGSRDGTAKIWDATWNRQNLALIHYPGVRVFAARLSHDGTRVITASNAGDAAIWDARSGQKIGTLGPHSGSVRDAAFSADGLTAVTASLDGTARLWNTLTMREVASLKHPGGVTVAIFSPDGRRLLTASQGGESRVWDVKTGQCVRVLGEGAKNVMCAVWSPNSQYVAVVPSGLPACVYDVNSGQAVSVLNAPYSMTCCVAFSPDGQRIATTHYNESTGPPFVTSDFDAAIWNWRTQTLIHAFQGHTRDLGEPRFSSDGTRLLTPSFDKTARIWDVESGQAIAVLEGHKDVLFTAAFTPDSKRVITASCDGTMRVWDTTDGRELLSIRAWVKAMEFSCDGRRLVTVGEHEALIWEALPFRRDQLPGDAVMPWQERTNLAKQEADRHWLPFPWKELGYSGRVGKD